MITQIYFINGVLYSLHSPSDGIQMYTDSGISANV